MESTFIVPPVYRPTAKGIPVHLGTTFTWEKGHGYADASDFPHVPTASYIYEDADDLGFYVVSHKTGKVLLFFYVRALTETPNSYEENHVGSLYRSECEQFEITIYND